MHGDIVELANQLGRQTWVIGYMPINFFVSSGSNLLTVTLCEVDHTAPNCRQGHQWSSAGMP
uniref:Uncharacterized protein n=1 Tax=Rhizophora mucronata TaxID=61149 RepID=A0A2P2IVG7_RHIMU